MKLQKERESMEQEMKDDYEIMLKDLERQLAEAKLQINILEDQKIQKRLKRFFCMTLKLGHLFQPLEDVCMHYFKNM